MQPNRTAGQAARFHVPIVDETGSPYSISGAAWEVFDEAGEPVANGVIDTSAVTDTVSFTVLATDMTLPQGVSSAGRELVVTIMTEDGPIELRDYFVAVNSNPLVKLSNSIVTYPEALALRQSFGPTLEGWDAITDHSQRASALMHAFANLSRIGYRVSMIPVGGRASDYAGYGTGTDRLFDMHRRVRLPGMTQEKFDELPTSFVRTLKRAQLVEADSILGGDVVGRKRQDGIISETIGESSTFFQSKPVLNMPISRRAYDILKQYISISVSIGR